MQRDRRPAPVVAHLGLALAAALGQLLLACSGSSEPAQHDGGTQDDGATQQDGSVDPTALVGTFTIELVAPDPSTSTPGYTSVLGKVYDAPVPEQIVWEESNTEGSCALLKPRVPFCATACGGSAVCVEDDTCQAYPTAQGVGTVTVSGLETEAGATQFTMDAIANNYQPVGVTLKYPAFAEGDALGLAAAGNSFAAAFTLEATGIASLELLNATVTLDGTSAVTLAWTAAAQPSASKIHVLLDISHHGGSKGKIECDLADTGSYTLSASFLSKLLALGVAGFPTIIITRRATDSAAIAAGRVDLIVASKVEQEVVIPGVQSCNDDDDCTTPETCQDDLTCG
jgi:hypothetical protein